MDQYLEQLSRCTGFQWDAGNADKVWERNHVSRSECEQLFFNEPLYIARDTKHSDLENRLLGLGRTDSGRRLFVVFTIRTEKIRVIAARDMSRKERRTYGRAPEEADDATEEEGTQ